MDRWQGTWRDARAATRHSDERLVALYLDMLAAERGAGTNTLAAYGRDLGDFTAYLAATGSTIASADTDDLRAYLGELAKRGLRPATIARRLSAIRQLYRFLYAEGQRKDDPAAVLEGPKRSRPLPKILTIAEVDRLLRVAAACDPAAPLPVRLRAARIACLVEMLYATGLRVSELVALPASAARRDARVIVVRGKGNKERLVPLNDAAKRAMATYLALARRIRPRQHPLPPQKSGCSHRSAKAATSRGSTSPATSRRSPHPRDSERRKSARTSCATPSPATCCTTAPTCAWCKRSRPRRHFDHADLHMCSKSA